MLRITTGKVTRPQKAVIYGPEGIGKSTLASQLPDPLFIDTEGGTSQLDVKRTQAPRDFAELVSLVNEIAAEPVCSTLVIDTIDWAEQLATEAVLADTGGKITSIEGFGYGKGYTYLGEKVSDLLHALDGVIASGKNVVLLAHAKMRKQELPDEQGAFDRWEMKLSRNVAPIVKEWADMLLFINYRTLVVQTDSGKNKAQGGQRVIHTTHNPCWDAKNRHGLPDEMPLSADALAPLFPMARDPMDDLLALMQRDGISEEQLRATVPARSWPEGSPLSSVATQMIRHWDKVAARVLANSAQGTSNNTNQVNEE